MPTYEFRCPAGHDFERFFGRISEAPAEVECPDCGAIASRRISGGAGLLFKGSGFYITDYGKDGKKDQRSSTSGGGSKAGESAGGGKSEGGTAASGGDAGAKGSGGGSSSGGTSSGSTSGGGTTGGGASKAGGE